MEDQCGASGRVSSTHLSKVDKHTSQLYSVGCLLIQYVFFCSALVLFSTTLNSPEVPFSHLDFVKSQRYVSLFQ